MMNRRGFLGLLGGAAGWLAAKPLQALAKREAVFTNFTPPAAIMVDMKDIVIGQYADYFSPGSIQTMKPFGAIHFCAMVHPFFMRDLLSLGPRVPRIRPGRKNRRERQRALMSIARMNATTRGILA